MKKYLILLSLLLILPVWAAQELRVESYVDKTRIGTDDYLEFTIEISGEDANQVKEPQLPQIKGFRNLGTSSSTSSSISVINGKMQSEYTKKYKYSLSPTSEGKFIIPPVTISFKNQTYKTSTVAVEVVKGSTEPAPPTSGNFNRSRTNQTTTSQSNLEDNLFVIAEVNKSTVYENEPVTVNYTLYTRYDISNLAFGSDPSYNGFWKEDVFTPKQISFSRRTYNNVLYNAMLMKTLTLFPTQSGKLEVPPLELKVDIRTQPTSFFDFGSTKQYSIKSDPIKLNVLNLPEEGKPRCFTNAVGSFSLNSNISQQELKVGDSFTYTLEITGTGNLKQFDTPTLPPIQHLRFVTPEVTSDINSDQKSGTKSIKYLVIAQEKGDFTIPPIEFGYFDTQQRKYRVLKTDSYRLQVAEGSGMLIASSTAQSVVKMEGKDIGFIIRNITLKNQKIFFESLVYWLIILLSIFCIPVSILYANEHARISGNIDYQRQKQADKILKKYMKQAAIHHKSGDNKFYTAAQTGLSSYLCDKLRIPRGSTTEMVLSEIAGRNLDPDLPTKIKAFFETCNQARFMPGGLSDQSIENDFRSLQNIVSEISRSKI
ncbi:MAG TPA: BatD family protein [Candidatus Cloacimonadota bacterium]|nr:BatD family protein [Candidatus Cloacimonadota bacterium]